MTSNSPTISIGMPIYNEERCLPQALDSLLGQDLGDFELIISDNASTDATAKICCQYGARDRRIRYARNEVNLGAVRNFNGTFALSSGRYFMWAAGHDLWHPSYLSRCLDVLANDPQVVLCYSQVGVISAEGAFLDSVREGIDTRGRDPFQRFRETLWGLVRIPYSDPIYGLIRSDALRQTHLNRNSWGGDNMILLELSLAGAMAQIKEPLYFRRQNRDRSANVERWTERYLEALDPGNRRRRIKLTYSAMCYGYMGIVKRSQFTNWQKLRLVLDIWRSVLGKFWRGFIFHDLLCSFLRLFVGERGVCLFKKRSYRLLHTVGLYK